MIRTISTPEQLSIVAPRPWDARLARWLIAPLRNSWITPNHLTTVRLGVGLAAGASFLPGSYGWTNLGALLLVLSNFLDHADGELARLTGKASRAGYVYDLASDAAVTILLFLAMGAGARADPRGPLLIPPVVLGLIAGCAIALIFFVRMRIEDIAGKDANRQGTMGGFETEDVLYLLPLVTLSETVMPFLAAAALCAPLFAVWVLIDFRRVRRHLASRGRTIAQAGGRLPQGFARTSVDPDESMNSRLRDFEAEPLRREFAAQGGFIFIPNFLAPEITAQLAAAVTVVAPSVNRNYLPGHKQGGSVSRHTIDGLAPFVADLYRSPALISWLAQLSGEPLQVSPAEDPHAYALYFYTRPGDHIGWHYDTSYYAGRRYTLLLGVVDESSCRLEYQLHSRDRGAAVVPGSVLIPPGGLVFFDGDKLRHRITPLCGGEVRVSLTFEYLTNPTMRPWRRVISNMKDAVAYFGFRQVFRRSGGA